MEIGAFAVQADFVYFLGLPRGPKGIPIRILVVKQDFARLRFNSSGYVGHSNNLL